MDIKKRYPWLFQSSSSPLDHSTSMAAPSSMIEAAAARRAAQDATPCFFSTSISKIDAMSDGWAAMSDQLATIKNQLQELERSLLGDDDEDEASVDGSAITTVELQQLISPLSPSLATSTSSPTSPSASCSPPTSTASKQLPLDTATAIAEDNIDGDGAAAEEEAIPKGDQEEEEIGAADEISLPPKDSFAASNGAEVNPLPPKDSFAASNGEEMGAVGEIPLPSKEDFKVSPSEASHSLDDDEDEDEACVDGFAVTAIELQQLISLLSPSPATPTTSSTSSVISSRTTHTPITIFAPSDESIRSCFTDAACFPSRLLKEHHVPGFFLVKPSPIGDICSSEHRAATQMLYDAPPISKLGLEEEATARPPPEPPPELPSRP